ncbi:MAG TPA: type II secretion system F family protein, partial [Candidatus Paceibacterota bacterium]
MSHFIYKAKRADGEIYKGERDAADRFELYRMLKDSSEEIVELHEKNPKDLSFQNFSIHLPFLGSVKTQEKINFARNLGAMITAGLAMSRALSVMERQTKNKELKKVLSSLQGSISGGKSLSESMSEHSKVFSRLFIAMV